MKLYHGRQINQEIITYVRDFEDKDKNKKKYHARNSSPQLLKDYVLDPQLKVKGIASEKFKWGQVGPSAERLALALLMDYGLSEREAKRLVSPMVDEIIQILPHEGWTIKDSDIRHFLEAQNYTPIKKNKDK